MTAVKILAYHMTTDHIQGSIYTDSKRLPGFLLGVVIALSALYVALEYTSADSTQATDDTLEDMVQDMDLQSISDQRDMIAATQAEQTVSTQIRTVETAATPAIPEAVASEPVAVASEQEATSTQPETTPALPQTPADDRPISFRVVQQIPQFEGGMEAFTKWLTQNLCYPAEAQMGRIQGKVIVSFIINRDGSISSPKIEQSVHPLLDREALRVVRMMPRWTPGKENDKPCRTLFAIPIVFQL